MDHKERCMASIEKTENLLRVFVSNPEEKEVFEKARMYLSDSKHFLEKEDYFSSFGASDYAYGLIEALIMVRSKR